MTGILQPLDNKFAIVDRHGNPTDYFIRWAQQKQIDIGSSITLTDLAAYLAAHKLASGQGIALTPDGNLADSPSISVLNGTGLDFDVMHNLKLADTTVVPGTYGDATHVPAIVVDQQGRITGVTLIAISGGGGAAWDFVPPTAASFTLASGDATNLTLTDDANTGLLAQYGAFSASYIIRAAYRTLSNKALDWTMVSRIRRTHEARNFRSEGMIIIDSISGKNISFELRNDLGLCVFEWTNLAGGFSATVYSNQFQAGTVVEWGRIRHTGGNYLFDVSPDGKNWSNITSIGDTAFTTNRADRVGLMGSAQNAGGPPLGFTIPYFSLTGPGV